MLQAVARTMVSLFWAIVFMLVVLYMTALILMQGVQDGLSSAREDKVGISNEMKYFISLHFDSISSTMLTIYKFTTGGMDWAACFDAVSMGGTVYQCFFLFYIAFFFFAVTNVLT